MHITGLAVYNYSMISVFLVSCKVFVLCCVFLWFAVVNILSGLYSLSGGTSYRKIL